MTHGKHALLSELIYDPTLQSSLQSDSDVRSIKSLYLPVPQISQTVSVPLAYVPLGQLVLSNLQLDAPE